MAKERESKNDYDRATDPADTSGVTAMDGEGDTYNDGKEEADEEVFVSLPGTRGKEVASLI